MVLLGFTTSGFVKTPMRLDADLRIVMVAALIVGSCCVPIASLRAQEANEASSESRPPPIPDETELAPAVAKVDVTPTALDDEIADRLQRVLKATEWFIDPEVRVDEGVVFLSGATTSDELKKWAGDLARNTQDVVAVVNRLEVREPSLWDFGPAWSGLVALWRDVLRSLPLFVFAAVVLLLAGGAGVLATRGARSFFRPRIRAKLLRNVASRAVGVLVMLVGIYIVLRVAGLTQLALTVIGGTGLIGLAVGIAFRDITENFLASLFLSMQHPFETGDLVEMAGVIGYVQQLNMRTTMLMTLDGNLVQIPNASVYKSNIRNFTANANRREDFVVGIGYDDAIHEAQEIVRRVLVEHPAVLSDPEPSVLVEGLGRATVTLRIYFWLDGRAHSWLKVRSSVIRLVKLAFQKHGISMPDEAREVIFPQGVPVVMLDSREAGLGRHPKREIKATNASPSDLEAPSTQAEGGLTSEARVIEAQAQQVQPLREDENLLEGPGDSASSSKKAEGSLPSSK